MKTKKEKLRICDTLLLAVTAGMLASGIQLEVISGESVLWVWIHVILGLLFFGLVGWHLELHFQWRNWFRLLWTQKSANTIWLSITGFITLVTAVAVTIGWSASPDHSIEGAVHGKFGFVFIALAIWHITRRIRFYIR